MPETPGIKYIKIYKDMPNIPKNNKTLEIINFNIWLCKVSLDW